MKIKKKELRRGLAQLPINYPDPDVLPDSLPGGVLDMDSELVQVELLCKRLAHNEVVVRDEVLAELPRYLKRLTAPIAELESSYQDEIAEVQAYFAAHPKTANPYHYDNLPVALQTFREKAQEVDRRARRREAVIALRKQRAQAKREKAAQGRYGLDDGAASEEEEEEDDFNANTAEERNEHKTKYHIWMQTWCDLELILLKLSRGIHYCLWHSDKPLVQLACAQRIADLLHAPATLRSKVLFYGAIFRVLSREWPTMDRYRLDKYLALVRKMIFAWVSFLKTVHDEESATVEKSLAGSSEVSPKSGKKKDAKSPQKATRKKQRDEEEEAAATTGTKSSVTARGIPDTYVKEYFPELPKFRQAISEVLYILQVQVLPNSTSTGLTMHVADVIFDELTRAQLSVKMFVTLTAGIPMYAMSQGNFVEKRVLDQFFPPLAGGVLVSRRTEQNAEQLRITATAAATKARKARRNHVAPTEEEITAEAELLAQQDNHAILTAVAECCQRFAVARGTAHAVRVMFSEAELVLRQAIDPDSYQVLTPAAQRRRLEREIEEVNETRDRVRDERMAMRQLKRQDRMEGFKERAKAKKESIRAAKGDSAADSTDEKALVKAIIAEEKAKKVKKPVRDTKRKKDYKLTKKDLYGDGEAEE